ncbi:outer membrane protein [Tabrizicola sp.]|uniref:outer membrane protein n=1 Tax=Tabrizicola sp. TaxID=2005166 RepID=UPI0035B3FE7F
MAAKEVALKVIGSGAAMLAGSAGLSHAQDVGGWYAGAGLGAATGDFSTFGDDGYSFDGTVGSIFAGYNVVSGNMVYGGELAWNGGVQGDSAYVDRIGSILDLKGRLGTIVGSTLVYGSLGYSLGTFEYGGESGDFNGFSLGAGFEMPFNDNGFFGADVTTRNMSGDGEIGGVPATDYIDDAQLTTVSIRLGFRF